MAQHPPLPPRAAVRRSRSAAAWVVGVIGLLDLVLAVTPPLPERLRAILSFLPMEVSSAATGVIVGVGLALLLLARAVSRGRKRAFVAVVGLLAGSVVLHVSKGLDLEEAALAILGIAFLIRRRDAFAVPGRPTGEIVATVAAVAGGVVAFGVAIGVVVAAAPSIKIVGAVEAVVERIAWIESTPLPVAIDRWMTAAMHGLGIGLVLVALRAALLPAVVALEARRNFERAANIVRRHGSDTLAYFALRDDKTWFVSGECLIAFGLFGDVRLVAPDPIGPGGDVDGAWAEFLADAEESGHAVAVLGASPAWVARYESHGFKGFYIGDEALVDCRAFTLEGRRIKTVREAVNRLRRAGYRVDFYDPATIDPVLRHALRRMWSATHGDDPERGFSMTLGRAFDGRDSGLLLAVATDPAGEPAGFCQFVPSKDGFSLDTMRRTRDAHPNGLMDFVVAETVSHVRDRGMATLGLNFAVMKAVLKGEMSDSPMVAAQRWILERVSEGTQISTLYRYNDKFDPEWVGRYLVYRSSLDLPGVALAVAKAESLWEIPVVGRLLRRATRARSA